MKRKHTHIKSAIGSLLFTLILTGCSLSPGANSAQTDPSTTSPAESHVTESVADDSQTVPKTDSVTDSSANTQSTDSAPDSSANTQSTDSAPDSSADTQSADSTEEPADEAADTSPYTLKHVVVLSRHNIRSPFYGGSSLLSTGTPHEWFRWTSPTSQLSLRGGILETTMGQYFRKWLESESLIPENYQPGNDEVRFYANAKQRTQATAHYFAAGMLPTANIEIERHSDFDTMDETFTPKIHFTSERFEADAMAQIAELGGESGLQGLDSQLKDSYALLENVLDLKDSEAYKSGELTGFTPGDTEITLDIDKEPSMTGSLKNATQFSDALILQCYEEPDKRKASFGHDLTEEEWLSLAEIKDVYQDVLFTAPLVAVNVAEPLLREIKTELCDANHVFTFLCGHDSNISSVLAAMDVDKYSLPNTLERDTPIGGKLTFELYEDQNGQSFCKISLIYQSTEQIRNMEILSLENPPEKYELEFAEIEKNEDGYYALQDINNRIQEALDLYNEYAKEEDALAPAA